MEPRVDNAAVFSRPDRGRTLLRASKILAAIFVLLVALLWRFPAGAKSYGYGAFRELIKLHTIAGTWHMEKMVSEHFYIKFKPRDRAEAELVLKTAELFYHPVTREYGYVPRGKVPLVLYSSREELNQSFGWEANESAMGVYWAGTIRVLSPAVWLDGTDPAEFEKAFISSGPMAHEFTHLMVDYLTGGNYPRWFTEGIAQYQEYKLTGFEFTDPAGSFKQRLYTMKELTSDFDSLPNQSLAYRQSFYAVLYIANHYGEDTLHQLLKELGRGREFSQSLRLVLGMDEFQLESRWQAWALQSYKN